MTRETITVQNIEIKARYGSFDRARKCVRELGGSFHETIHQTDVYFRVGEGRMKLRYIDGRSGYLVFYLRDNNPEPRASEYHIYNTENPQELEQVLAAAFGVLATVQKKREVHLIDNVRVHLDEVETLGRFIEFEAVLTEGKVAVQEKQKVEEYIDLLKIDRKKLIAKSYLDLILPSAS